MFPPHCGLFLSQLPKPFHVGGHGEDDEDADGQDYVSNQKDEMERRQMNWRNEANDVPLAQQELLSLCHSCETARDQHLAVKKQKIHSSQSLFIHSLWLMFCQSERPIFVEL